MGVIHRESPIIDPVVVVGPFIQSFVFVSCVSKQQTSFSSEGRVLARLLASPSSKQLSYDFKSIPGPLRARHFYLKEWFTS
mmetsp:Transcript_49467/g.120088  ORF Transcript_49467/g.120088 Transcript_49467/m.120088 type:complete len:81 (+) Transcript_49467:745-987(+)